MKTIITIVGFIGAMLLNGGCSQHHRSFDLVVTDSIINPCYIGNGAQWDPYQLNYGKGELTISDADWQKLYSRLDNMRPQLMRVMINAASMERDGKFDPYTSYPKIQKILEYCQSRQVNVLLGDWGWGQVDAKKQTINEKGLRYAAENLRFLVNEKRFTCIKYFNLINEPNGYWAATEGNYQLWAKAIQYFHGEISRLGLSAAVKIVGPDAAIWTPKETWWIDSCATHLRQQVGLYDIHTYPSKIIVNSGEYSNILRAYKSKVPAGSQLILGEIGFKFIEKADSSYAAENNRRIAAHGHASIDDSQMFVFDYMYGLDMADALMQTANEGLSGCVAWMLDDAMYSGGAPDKLKIWGFWNIFGDEQFGADQEVVRPWFYAWSMLTRYMPSGCKVYQVSQLNTTGIRAIAVEKDGKQMMALLNLQQKDNQVIVGGVSWGELANVNQFVYQSNQLRKEGDSGFLPNQTGLTVDFSKGFEINLPAESLVVITNMN